MRLDKLIIGSDKLSIKGCDKHRFKNLKNVKIDFDQDEWITVVIGRNGTGKSNVIEALTHIFCELAIDAEMLSRKPEITFAYELIYFCHNKKITIKADPDKLVKDIYEISYIEISNSKVDESEQLQLLAEEDDLEITKTFIKYTTFKKSSADFLPQFIFGYYSGHSDRLQVMFNPYLKRYDEQLRQGKTPDLRRLFYALPEHSQFVLLAFIQKDISMQDQVVKNFLEKEIGLDPDEGFDSVLFVIKQPSWDKNPTRKKLAKQNGTEFIPDIFWGAEGVVRQFLDRLLDISLAPITNTRIVKNTLWEKGKETEFVYLYVQDLEGLAQLRGSRTDREFFRELESTYVSELIDETRIRVKLRKHDGSVTFKELSEGEQQLLTVLGLLRFTAEEESLFLLDEPDTHLNPKWSIDYIQHLKDFINTTKSDDSSSHIVLTTHNPLAIAELKKEQVQILHSVGEDRSIHSITPEQDPQGMGYSGIITSDLFGLGSSLDKTTTNALLELHNLSSKFEPLSLKEQVDLKDARELLSKLDFNFASSDRLEREFSRASFDLAKSGEKSFDSPILTNKNKEKALEILVQSLLESLEKENHQ